jgi:lipopolysaccharide export system protein LptA
MTQKLFEKIRLARQFCRGGASSFFSSKTFVWASIALKCSIFLSFFTTAASAQQAPSAQVPQDTQKLKIETAQVIENFRQGDRDKQKLSGSVRLRQENTLIYCDTAVMDQDYAILQGNVVIAEGDSSKVFADSCHYNALTKISYLFKDVVLVSGKQQLYTQVLRYDSDNKIATYHSGATMSNGKSQLKSRHGYYYTEQKKVYFKGDVVATDPEFTMRTDTMTYDTNLETVYFVAPTLISQEKSKIYTEGGFYDIEHNFAEFDLNPQYEKENQRGRADRMRYEGTLKTYTLQGNAYIEDLKKGEVAEADVIRYNTDTEKSTLRGNAHFRDSTRDIQGDEIRYDSKSKAFQMVGQGILVDGSSVIEADSLDFNDELGVGMAQGRVFWLDTASNYSVEAFRMDYNKKTEYLYAHGGFQDGVGGRPLFKTPIDRDTLYMSADTLSSFKSDTSQDFRTLIAYRNVKIFKSDMQAVADSLSYSSADSIFWFYKIKNLPLVWSDTSQFSGDTIKMQLKNKKLDRIWLRQNALVVNSEDEVMFNQIKGRYNTVYFQDDQAREMLVEGNAEALYYALDEKKAYVGVNETTCSHMRLFFGDNKVENIKFYQQPTGKFTPMKKAGQDTKKLVGFFWEKKRRPKSIADLLKIQ